jgi:hypothetical protein
LIVVSEERERRALWSGGEGNGSTVGNSDVSTIIVKTHRKVWGPKRFSAELEKQVVVLESYIQTEDVTDLKGGAVVHHEVATDNSVYVVWRRRRKHRFQARGHGCTFFCRPGGKDPIHDQLPLQSGRKMIAFGQTRRQMIIGSAVPVADFLSRSA